MSFLDVKEGIKDEKRKDIKKGVRVLWNDRNDDGMRGRRTEGREKGKENRREREERERESEGGGGRKEGREGGK